MILDFPSRPWFDLGDMRARLFSLAIPNEASVAYAQNLGADFRDIVAHAGCLAVLPCRYFADRTFEFADDGIPSVVIEAFGPDDETVVDLVAWPVSRPDKYTTAVKNVSVLGSAQIENPATYAGGHGLFVHKTPDAWLRSACRGVVPINLPAAAELLSKTPGNLIAEDRQHGWEIARALGRGFDASRILAPVRRAAA